MQSISLLQFVFNKNEYYFGLLFRYFISYNCTKASCQSKSPTITRHVGTYWKWQVAQKENNGVWPWFYLKIIGSLSRINSKILRFLLQMTNFCLVNNVVYADITHFLNKQIDDFTKHKTLRMRTSALRVIDVIAVY